MVVHLYNCSIHAILGVFMYGIRKKKYTISGKLFLSSRHVEVSVQIGARQKPPSYWSVSLEPGSSGEMGNKLLVQNSHKNYL